MVNENQEVKSEKTDQTEEKKSGKMLEAATIIVAVALVAVISLIWLNFRKDSSEIKDVAISISTEEGQVLGASTRNPQYLSNLAENLKKVGFVLYGSSSDSATKRQKDLFSQAAQNLDFVECNPGFDNSNPDECVAKEIDKYPTWVKGEEKFPGYKSLDELEELISG